ncbi:hypothetical protein ACHQM5_030738 [Ranunculus cassubicifolius]
MESFEQRRESLIKQIKSELDKLKISRSRQEEILKMVDDKALSVYRSRLTYLQGLQNVLEINEDDCVRGMGKAAK